MKTYTYRLLNLMFGVMFMSSPAIATDLCEHLEGMRLSINANGYVGITSRDIRISLEKAADNSYIFETELQMINDQPEKITGECKDRHIIFTRKQENLEQVFDGWIFEKDGYKMAGIFSHNGPKRWGWYGNLTDQNNTPKMRVPKITVAPPNPPVAEAQQGLVTNPFASFRDRLTDSTVNYSSGGEGKDDTAQSKQFPTPSNVNLVPWLNSHKAELGNILKKLFSRNDYQQFQTAETKGCQRNLLCEISYRQQAISYSLGNP